MEIWKPTPMAGVKWLIPRMYTFDDKSQYKTYRIPCKYKYSTVEVNAILSQGQDVPRNVCVYPLRHLRLVLSQASGSDGTQETLSLRG